MRVFPETFPPVKQALRTYEELYKNVAHSDHFKFTAPPVSAGHVLAVEVERLRATLQELLEEADSIHRQLNEEHGHGHEGHNATLEHARDVLARSE